LTRKRFLLPPRELIADLEISEVPLPIVPDIKIVIVKPAAVGFALVLGRMFFLTTIFRAAGACPKGNF